MDKEFAMLERLLDNRSESNLRGRRFVAGAVGENEVVAMKCGIGKVNSAVGAVEMIDAFAPDLVVSTGVAGGAWTGLEVRDVVVGAECCYHDVYCGSECKLGQVLGMPERYAAPARVVERAMSMCGGAKLHKGLIVSGDWFVDSREKMRSILDGFPDALAVDMESCSIAQVCHLRNVPFVSFRIISDIPLKDTKAQMYYDFWDKMAEGSFHVAKSFLSGIGSSVLD